MDNAKEKFLSTLNSSTSRVYATLLFTRGLETAQQPQPGAEAGPPQLLFANARLNRCFVVKETTTRVSDFSLGNYTETKIVIPYNPDQLGDGAVSYMPKMRGGWRALQDAGLLSETHDDPRRIRDQAIIDAFCSIPSYAPFLVKDRLQSKGIQADDAYFAITPQEYEAVRAFINQRFDKMVQTLIPPNAPDRDGRVEKLTHKLWFLDDLDALQDIARAFSIPKDRTFEVFYGWKGISYFEYEYARIKQRLMDLVTWLASESEPVDYVPKDLRKDFDADRDGVAKGMVYATRIIHSLLKQYNDSFDKLFVHQTGSADFVEFLITANEKFWQLGENISKIEHALSVIDSYIERLKTRRFQFVHLSEIIAAQRAVFAMPERPAGEVDTDADDSGFITG
ncbi:hypothetical protein V6B08_04325 [Ferrovibrio sp. MS7]|jgi:hypothetical protein|uniref:hypothetical protein n=1 Tax=Ferrovibrio plantarum TaxID=3119164 RepID=UPI003136E1F6